MGFDEEQSAQRTMSMPDNLAGEHDATDLGETVLARSVYMRANILVSQVGLQAGVTSKLYYDRDLRNCLQHHGAITVHCLDFVLFDSSWTSGNGLGWCLE